MHRSGVLRVFLAPLQPQGLQVNVHHFVSRRPVTRSSKVGICRNTFFLNVGITSFIQAEGLNSFHFCAFFISVSLKLKRAVNGQGIHQ